MTVYDLVAALGGELVCNQARVRRDGKWVVLAQIQGPDWVMTEIGQRLLDSTQGPVVAPTVEPVPVRRGRPRKETATSDVLDGLLT